MPLRPLTQLRPLTTLTPPAPPTFKSRIAAQFTQRKAARRSPLDRLYLTGTRNPETLRLLVAVDVSMSMTGCASARDAALSTFTQWAMTNMHSDDEVAVLDFAAAARVRLRPTPLAQATATLPKPSRLDSSDTRLNPLLHTIRRLPPSGGRTALLLLSDAQLADLPTTSTAGQQMLQEHGIDDLRLLVPGPSIPLPAQWDTVFPMASPDRFDGRDADATGLALARALASLTGQRLAWEDE
ncbi:hypothetical protein ACWC3X_38400 [Streptomyces populi]